MRRLLQRCLEKDARQRLRDIGDLRHELEHALSDMRSRPDSGAVPAPDVSHSRASAMALAATGLGLLILLGAGVVVFRLAKTATPVVEPALQLTNFNDSALMPSL